MTTLSDEARRAIQEEEEIVSAIRASLEEQMETTERKLVREEARARELTSQLVAASRDEDKQLLASDEAVSHALKKSHSGEKSSLTELIEKPYFARFVVEEELPNGKTTELEYRLGTSANPDCRIIDWRKAPISKLYYEYQEGEEYSEEIQNRERTGTIKLRNSVDIRDGALRKLRCRHGSFVLGSKGWEQASGASSRSSASYGRLPNILALITADQFRMITEDAETAIIIQGIAGSGKSTVALHRLAWLLHEDNSDVQEADSLIIVPSVALKAYMSASLPELQIPGVKINTFREWVRDIISRVQPRYVNHSGEIARSSILEPMSVRRVKGSLGFLRVFEHVLQSFQASNREFTYFDALRKTFESPKEILSLDESKLLNLSLIEMAKERSLTVESERSTLDFSDEPLFVRYVSTVHGGIPLSSSKYGKVGHLVIDEVQDYAPSELAAMFGSAKSAKDLTIVGDSAQQIHGAHEFPGWDALMQEWGFAEHSAQFVKLTVSHRSTLPIMKLAGHILEREVATDGRSGRTPIWFKALKEESGIQAGINWLKKAIERYPDALTAVLCSSPQEAKQTLSLLKPSFGHAVRLGDLENFTFDEGILVTCLDYVKGLEFLNVLLWNPSEKQYPRSQQNQNRLYVAATRAEENLCIVTWNRPSPFLPSIHSKLVRGYELDVEEEE